MKKSVKRMVALGLCAALVAGGVGTTAAWSGTKEVPAVKVSSAQAGTTKDETVYVFASADGSVQKVIVSDWIQNPAGSDTVADRSELEGIETVTGDATYSINGDNMKIWDAKGEDIYYQGETKKELPVGLTVSYKLDGKSVSVRELAGKSGRVTIRFDYENRQYETVSIDGKEERIYVPFAMLTGMLLENDHFRNVEVSNGKVLNDGNRTAVVGFALPGLQENLALDADKIELPDSVEITADVTDFSLGMTVTVAANEIFNEIDTAKLDSLDGLSGSLTELTGVMEQLMDGSSRLYGGLCTLLDKSGELVGGINQLAAGAKALRDGAVNLDDGAAALKTGASELSVGLGTLAANNDTLNGGARQVFETLLSAADTQLAAAGLTLPHLTVENYAEVLDGVIASLDENAVYETVRATVAEEVEKNRPAITEKVTEAVRAEVTKSVTEAVRAEVTEKVTAVVRTQVAEKVIPAATNGAMTRESYEAALAAGQIDEKTESAVTAATSAQMKTDAVQETIRAEVERQMESAEIKTLIEKTVEEQMSSAAVKEKISEEVDRQVEKAISEAMASPTVQEQLKAASEGASSVIALKTSLDSYNSFYLGLKSYTGGVKSAAAGAGKLSAGAAVLADGTAALRTGAGELYSGILQLKDGAPALVDGVTELRDGSMQLSDGLKEFNERGISKLVDAVDGGAGSLLTRVKATVDVSKDYKSFAGIGDGMDGTVKFIYRTEEIGEREK